MASFFSPIRTAAAKTVQELAHNVDRIQDAIASVLNPAAQLVPRLQSLAGYSGKGGLVTRLNVQQSVQAAPNVWTTPPSFVSSGGSLLLFLSGMGFSSSNSVGHVFSALIDGVVVASQTITINQVNTHTAFPTICQRLTSISSGNHTFQASVDGTTIINSQDLFQVLIIEFPF
jgi:hypothetical protein